MSYVCAIYGRYVAAMLYMYSVWAYMDCVRTECGLHGEPGFVSWLYMVRMDCLWTVYAYVRLHMVYTLCAWSVWPVWTVCTLYID